MPHTLPSTVTVHGLPYLALSPAALRDLLADRLRADTQTVIFTPNAKIGADALDSPELHSMLTRADFLLPDGAGVVAASRHQHPEAPLKHRLPGIEAGEMTLELCADLGMPVFFLGGKTNIAAGAAVAWRERLPRLTVAGVQDGYFEKSGKENEAVVQKIEASGAQVVFVCFGCPRQERWILENRSALPAVRLFMGLGGSLDVWAGKLRRAPVWIQRLGLEWLWRTLRQPRRIGAFFHMLHYVYTPAIREK